MMKLLSQERLTNLIRNTKKALNQYILTLYSSLIYADVIVYIRLYSLVAIPTVVVSAILSHLGFSHV